MEGRWRWQLVRKGIHTDLAVTGILPNLSSTISSIALSPFSSEGNIVIATGTHSGVIQVSLFFSLFLF
jgi:hypothetical protein